MVGLKKDKEPCVLAPQSESPGKTAGADGGSDAKTPGMGVLHGQRASRSTSFLSRYLLSLPPSGTFVLIITKAAVPFLRQSPNPFHSELPHLQPNFPISPMNPKTQKTREWAFGVLLWHSIPSLKESLRKKLLGFVLRLPHSCLSFPGCFPQTPVYRHGVENVKHKIL